MSSFGAPNLSTIANKNASTGISNANAILTKYSNISLIRISVSAEANSLPSAKYWR